MKIEINKLFFFQGRFYASIRDYKIRDCVKKGEPLTIIYKGEKMELKKWQVAFFEQFTPDTFKSKTGGKDYKLFDYYWHPIKDKDKELRKLAEIGVFG